MESTPILWSRAKRRNLRAETELMTIRRRGLALADAAVVQSDIVVVVVRGGGQTLIARIGA